jgi:hypothetical protein
LGDFQGVSPQKRVTVDLVYLKWTQFDVRLDLTLVSWVVVLGSGVGALFVGAGSCIRLGEHVQGAVTPSGIVEISM